MALTTDQGLKMNFENIAVFASLWIEVKNEYSKPAEITLKSLLLFPSTHHWWADCSTTSVVTRRQRRVYLLCPVLSQSSLG